MLTLRVVKGITDLPSKKKRNTIQSIKTKPLLTEYNLYKVHKIVIIMTICLKIIIYLGITPGIVNKLLKVDRRIEKRSI